MATKQKMQSLNKALKGTNSTRSLMVKADFVIDLESPNILPSMEVVEAMRRRIIELEDALTLATGAQGGPPKKRARTGKPVSSLGEMPIAGPSVVPSAVRTTTSAIIRVDSKKIDALLKKFWTTLQKEVRTEKYKFQGGDPKACRIEEVVELDEFRAIFEGKGLLIQPTPSNKPMSTVTIIKFGGKQVEELFGKYYKDLKGNRYSIGGIMAQWEKGKKIGPVALQVNDLTVTYARNTLKCALKFEVEEASPYYLGHNVDFNDYGSYNRT